MMCFILQGCVFEYKRGDAIRQRMVMNNAMIDVIKARMRKDSNWVVKVVMREKEDHGTGMEKYASRRNHNSFKRDKK